MDEICQIANTEKVDLVMLSGDMFDNFNPSTEAINLYYDTLKRLSNYGNRAVVLIAGNHDSADLIEASDPLARACGIITAGYPDSKPELFKLNTGLEIIRSDHGFIELRLPYISYPIRILLTPYANEKRLKKYLGNIEEEQELRDVLSHQWNRLSEKYCDEKGVNLLMAHLFFMKKGDKQQAEPDDEKPILHIGGAQAIYTEQIPDSIQYTALGHLHRMQSISGASSPVIYSSSPIAYSFGEAEQDKYVVIIEVEPGKKAEYSTINLHEGKRLLRRRFEDIDKALIWLNDNQSSLVELTIVADNYLQAKDRKRLYDVHSGIINIIPEIKSINKEVDSKSSNIDLEQNIEELFEQYFKHKKAQEPNDDIMQLLKEILAVE